MNREDDGGRGFNGQRGGFSQRENGFNEDEDSGFSREQGGSLGGFDWQDQNGDGSSGFGRHRRGVVEVKEGLAGKTKMGTMEEEILQGLVDVEGDVVEVKEVLAGKIKMGMMKILQGLIIMDREVVKEEGEKGE